MILSWNQLEFKNSTTYIQLRTQYYKKFWKSAVLKILGKKDFENLNQDRNWCIKNRLTGVHLNKEIKI